MNIVIAVGLVAGGGTFGYVVWRLNQIDRVHINAVVPVGHDTQSRARVAAGQAPAAPPETFLIVGSDSRAALDQPGDSAQYGSAAEVGGARSDTIMLARVVPATKQIALLSIPRDTYLDIPGLGMQKINAALGVSPNLLVQVIEKYFGLDINHYIDVDFDSFKDIADALGGVEIYFPTQVRDVNAGLYINAPGCVNLTGNLALAFVRSREYTYYVPGKGFIQEGLSDLARIQRQQIFIRKLAAKAQSEGLGDPVTLNGIIAGLTKNLTVDDTLSNEDLVSLAETFRNINPADIVGWTMPTTAEVLQTSSGPDDILLPQAAQDKALEQQFLAFGEPPPAPAASAPGTTTPPRTVPTVKAPATTRARPATTAPTPSTVPASSVAVTVVNGSGIAGQAGRTATGLEALRFDVVGTETASTFGHVSTVVEYGPGGQAAAQTVASYLEGPITLQQTDGLRASSVEIITGTALTGVRTTAAPAVGSTTSSSASTSTSTAPSTTTSTVPATTTTTYVLPGTPSTGVPSCPS
jgi:LCP family protein required for cell wall assembly